MKNLPEERFGERKGEMSEKKKMKTRDAHAWILNLNLIYFRILGQLPFGGNLHGGKFPDQLSLQIWSWTVILVSAFNAGSKIFLFGYLEHETVDFTRMTLLVLSYFAVAVSSLLTIRKYKPLLMNLSHILTYFPRVNYKGHRSYSTELILLASLCFQLYFLGLNFYAIYEAQFTSLKIYQFGRAIVNFFIYPVGIGATLFAYGVMTLLCDALGASVLLIQKECLKRRLYANQLSPKANLKSSQRPNVTVSRTIPENMFVKPRCLSYIDSELNSSNITPMPKKWFVKSKRLFPDEAEVDSSNISLFGKMNADSHVPMLVLDEIFPNKDPELQNLLVNCERLFETALDTSLLYMNYTSLFFLCVTGHCIFHTSLNLFLFVVAAIQGMFDLKTLSVACQVAILFFSVNNSVDHFKHQHSVCRQQFRMMVLGCPALQTSPTAQRIQAMFDRNVEFSLMGFANFGRAFLSSVFSFVLTYLIIAVQFRLSEISQCNCPEASLGKQ